MAVSSVASAIQDSPVLQVRRAAVEEDIAREPLARRCRPPAAARQDSSFYRHYQSMVMHVMLAAGASGRDARPE